MMAQLGHKRIDYLKMDVEGAEFESIPLLEELPLSLRPSQIGLEVHHGPVRADGSHVTHFIDFIFLFHRLGYRLMSRDDNDKTRCCTELLFVLESEFKSV